MRRDIQMCTNAGRAAQEVQGGRAGVAVIARKGVSAEPGGCGQLRKMVDFAFNHSAGRWCAGVRVQHDRQAG